MFHRFNRSVLILSVFSIAVLTATVLAGPIWDCKDPQEPGGTPDTSKTISGSGQLATVRCTLTGSFLADFSGPEGDFEDMFLVRIANPGSFQMRTVDPLTGDEFNTQIWVFDLDGRGILANSLDLSNPPFSLMGNAANDGSGSTIVAPGLYYIAISGGDGVGPGRHPVDADGLPIFNFDPSFPELIYGPASPEPVVAWKGEGEIGDYEIEFIGVEFVPVGSVPTITEWGAILLALLLLAAGTLVIRQHQRRSAVAPA